MAYRTTLRRFAVLALLSLTLALPVMAATVRVQVVDENGLPVVRPFVYLQRAEDGATPGGSFRRSRRAEADADGRARFDGLQPGYYVVGASGSSSAWT